MKNIHISSKKPSYEPEYSDSEVSSAAQSPVPLIVIVGMTATGKSELAIRLAERFDGEIVCADSRTIYRGMDIGTAKPSLSDRARAPHWGLDLVEPNEPFTVADFKVYAERTIEDIGARGRLPIMVGGSGLYIDAVLYDYRMLVGPDMSLRRELMELNVEALQAKHHERGLALPADSRNPHRLIRNLETGGALAAGKATDRNRGIRSNTLVIGIEMPIEAVEAHIRARVQTMMAAGLTGEVVRLADDYGWAAKGLQAPGYREYHPALTDDPALIDEHVIAADIVKSTRALAKRQRTWFRRNKSIHWLATEDRTAEAVDLVTTFLHTRLS